MADPLSIVASVVGISAAAVQASTAVVKLVRTIKDAPREIQTILTDLDDFKGVVSNLTVNLGNQMIQEVLRGDKGLTDTVKSVSSPLKSCATEMTHLRTRITKNLKPAKEGSSQRFISTSWYWRKSEVVECMSRLQSNKLNLNIALSSIVSYCTLRSYAMDSTAMNIDIDFRRKSTDTDAGSALQQYAASIAQDTRSIGRCEEHSDREPNSVVRLQTIDKGFEQLEKDDRPVDELLGATNRNRPVIIKELIEQGADVDRHGSSGKAPIHIAANSGFYDTAVTLLNHDADPNNPMKGGGISYSGSTPLHLAAKRGHEDLVRLLLVYGADINARGPGSKTPLIWAIYKDRLNIVKMMIQKGANINLTCDGGITALHYAVEFGHLDIVQLLVKRGADIEACTDQPGYVCESPLMTACMFRQHHITAFLLEAGAKIDACQPDGVQAMHQISWFSKSLLESNSQNEVKVVNLRRKTPSIYLLLLDFGADLEARTRDGRTALLCAASKGNIPGMEFLLSKGASLDVRDSKGHNVLWYAKQGDLDYKAHNEGSVELWLVQWLREHPGRRHLH